MSLIAMPTINPNNNLQANHQLIDALDMHHHLAKKHTYVQPHLTFDNKVNRLVVPLYCGTCRAYGCQCYNNSESTTTTTTTNDSAPNSETTSFTDNPSNTLDFCSPSFTLPTQQATNSMTSSDYALGNKFAPHSPELNDFNQSSSNHQGPGFYHNNNSRFLFFNSDTNSDTNRHNKNLNTMNSNNLAQQFSILNLNKADQGIGHQKNTNNSNIFIIQSNDPTNRVFYQCDTNGSYPNASLINTTTYMTMNQQQQQPDLNEANFINSNTNFHNQSLQMPNSQMPKNMHFFNYLTAQQKLEQNSLGNNNKHSFNKQTFNRQHQSTQSFRHRKQSFSHQTNNNICRRNNSNIANINNNEMHAMNCKADDHSLKNAFYFSHSNGSSSSSNNSRDSFTKSQQIEKNSASQSFSSNSSNAEIQFIRPNVKLASNRNNIQYVSNLKSRQKEYPTKLIIHSYKDFDKKPPKKIYNSGFSRNNSKPFTANTALRNKKFAAYESILYCNSKSSDQSSTSSSLSASPTPLLDEFSPPLGATQYDQYHINGIGLIQPQQHVVHNRNRFNRLQKQVQSQILCRLGNNCRYKRENKCKYFHPVLNKSHKYKNEDVIEISDYSIDLNEVGIEMDTSFLHVAQPNGDKTSSDSSPTPSETNNNSDNKHE